MNTPKSLFLVLIIQLVLLEGVYSKSTDSSKFNSTIDSMLSAASVRLNLLDNTIPDSLSCQERLILFLNRTVYANTIQQLALLRTLNSFDREFGADGSTYMDTLDYIKNSVIENIHRVVSNSLWDNAVRDQVTSEITHEVILPLIAWLAIERMKSRFDLRNTLRDSFLCDIQQRAVGQLRSDGVLLHESANMLSPKDIRCNYRSTATDIESIARVLEKLIRQKCPDGSR